MYKVIIENKAIKEIERLDREILDRVIKVIQSLKQNPRPLEVKKLFAEDGWRIRIGDYRVLYTIDDKQKLITIYRVKHRKEVYR